MFPINLANRCLGRTDHRFPACRRIPVLALLALVVGVAHRAQAQWDVANFAAPGPDERVRAMVMHDDGSGPALYVGGEFLAIDGQPMRGIARYRDGVWSQVGGGATDGRVHTLLSQGADLIAGGNFDEIGGVAAQNIARWDGSTWHPYGHGLVGQVNSLVMYDNQLIAGDWSRVSRWDGAEWQQMGGLFEANALVVYQDQLIVAGGSNPVDNIARWNGSAWEGLEGGGTNSDIYALAVFNGELVATGSFTSAGGAPASRIARWNGQTWKPLGAGLDRIGRSLAVQDEHLIIGGEFTIAGDMPIAHLAMWDGVSWSSVPGGISGDLGIAVNALLPIVDGSGPALMVGGLFATAGGVCANNIAMLRDDQWSRLSQCEQCLGASGQIAAMTVYDDGAGPALYVAGKNRCAGMLQCNGVARWDGTSWSQLGDGFDGDAYVMSLAVFDDGSGKGPRLYAAGWFSGSGGIPLNNIAVWNGATWLPVGGGLSGGIVLDLQVFNDGAGDALYACGAFATAGIVSASRIAKWNGVEWSSVAGGIDAGAITDMIVWNQSLVIAGTFSTVGGVPARSVARWQGGAWHHINPGGPWDGGEFVFIRSLTTWPDPEDHSLIMGGFFRTPGLTFYDGLTSWNGNVFESIAPGEPSQDPGFSGAFKVFATDDFECPQLFMVGQYDDGTNERIRVWNGSAWRSMAGGIADAVGYWLIRPVGGGPFWISFGAFAEFQGRLYVAGDFTSAGGQPASNIAIWDVNASLSCLTDANDDGVVNIDDLLTVVSEWGPCEACAGDHTPCGGDGVVGIDDLLGVISAWGPCR
jgi:trimeric autotransporter adhesin